MGSASASWVSCSRCIFELDTWLQSIYSHEYTAISRKVLLQNGEKLTRQCRKLLWVMVVFTVCLSEPQGVSAWWKETAETLFVISRSLLLNHLEPISNKAKLLLPIMPIGIVAYAFTLSWDNLCPSSCIYACLHGECKANCINCLLLSHVTPKKFRFVLVKL